MRVEGVIAAAFALTSTTAVAQPLAVDAINASETTICAEADNVYVKFEGSNVRRFTVEAVHPSYLASVTRENKEPDFTDCKMSRAADALFTPRRVTLYDDGNWKLIGITYPNFWRGTQVPVRIGDKIDSGFHLLQLWTRGRARDEEVLVLYPADGYWRARPLGPAEVKWQIDPILPTAYGSSFLVGPVEQEGRPFVDVKDVTFDPAAGTFRLSFARGGGGTVRVAALDETRISLDVTFDAAMPPQFAALRSMFVTTDNADVSIAWWKDAASRAHQTGIMEFGSQSVTEFRAGRELASRHNNTAPDMVFRDFTGSSAPAR